MLTVGSLFSGIGGIDLGLERAGMTVKWHSEIDPYASKVLKKHWPQVPNLGDIKQINWEEVEKVDVIAGGYPCQPFSTAGLRKGESDSRHLWPFFFEAISRLRPRYAILENVRGHLSMGFDRVLGDLAEIGYDAEWEIVSAASVGAPHRRDRIICVAYPNNAGSRTSERDMGSRREQTSPNWERYKGSFDGSCGCCATLANTTGSRCKTLDSERKADWTTNDGKCHFQARQFNGWWEIEPDVGRVAHGVPSRVDRLRGLGNAVVPQVAEYVGRLIMEAHNV